MSNQFAKQVHACSTCGASVQELRRGRCWSCYTRWSEQRPVGLGACCAVCDERRRDNLRLLEVQGRSLAMCHLCAARVAKLDVVPYSIEGLRAALRRDRRQVERREGAPDARTGEVQPVQDRRALQRRGSLPSMSLAGVGLLPEDSSVLGLDPAPADLDLNLASFEGEVLSVDDDDIVEATVVAEAPRKPESAPAPL